MTTPIRRVLVPLDGSRTAEVVLPHCRAIGEAFGAEILFLHVLAHARAGGTPLDSVNWRIRRAKARSYLEGLALRMRESGLRVELELAEGRAPTEIVRVAGLRAVDLIILSSHGHGGPGDFGLGGVAHKVVERVGVSVLVVRAGDAPVDDLGLPRVKRVVVAVDCSHQGDWSLSIAARLARHLCGELRMLHVVAVPEFPERTPGDFVNRVYRTRLIEANRAAARAYLDAMAERLSSPDLTVAVDLVEAPSVVRSLAEYERGAEGSLLVVSAHGVSQDSPFPYGPVVSHVLVHGRLPVLVLQDQPRPAGLAPASAPAAERGVPSPR
ncbi:MAG: universal stress protein [Gemmatimonadota bacterium]